MANMAPDRRLRCKTPDPKRHKSPDAKSLRKAEKHVKEKKLSGSEESSTRRALSFDDVPRVHDIVAQHPAGDRRPAGTMPAPRRKAAGRMSTSEADKILEKFVQEQDT